MSTEAPIKTDSAAKGKATTKAEVPEVRVIKPFRRPELTAQISNAWTVFAPDEVTVKDIENPDMWSAAGKMAQHDTVQVIANEWWALCLVTDSRPGYTAVSVLMHSRVVRPDAIGASDIPPGYRIQLAQPGGFARYAVIRESDGTQINVNHREHQTHEAARRWLIDLHHVLTNH